MYRVFLKHPLALLRDFINNDVPGLEFRIYFYGSRQQGTVPPESDLDPAIEFSSPWRTGKR